MARTENIVPRIPDYFGASRVWTSTSVTVTHAYVLDETYFSLGYADIRKVISITGTVDHTTYTFVEGTDYDLRNGKIYWIPDWNNEDTPTAPDDGTTVTVQFYVSPQLYFDFMDIFGKELDETDNKIDQIERDHWIDYAEGDALDKLGVLFNLTRVDGETDAVFRARIKSTVPDYSGGGTINAIKEVVYGYTGVYPTIADACPTNPDYDATIADAWFKITTDSGNLVGVSSSDLYDAIERTKAAGVYFIFELTLSTLADSVTVNDNYLAMIWDKEIDKDDIEIDDTDLTKICTELGFYEILIWAPTGFDSDTWDDYVWSDT